MADSSLAEKKIDIEEGHQDLEFAVDGDHGTKRHLVRSRCVTEC